MRKSRYRRKGLPKAQKRRIRKQHKRDRRLNTYHTARGGIRL